MEKFFLNGEPSWPAVHAVCCAVKQASRIILPAVTTTLPTAVLPVAATSPTETVTIASSPRAKDTATDQTAPATAQSISPAAATESPVIKPMAINEIMCSVNEDVSIIEESPFPKATALRSPKVGILWEIHPCRGLVINFHIQELISSDSDEEEIWDPSMPMQVNVNANVNECLLSQICENL
uniref:Uncharacterized protein n=1 Tax=Romanomermis culicivorax TaxID=13658 RepID=A0A915JPK4_ROMCU